MGRLVFKTTAELLYDQSQMGYASACTERVEKALRSNGQIEICP